MNKEEFEKLKGQLLACTPIQQSELANVLRVAMAKNQPSSYFGNGQGALLYSDLREVLKRKANVELPGIGTLRSARPWLVEEMRKVELVVEAFLDRELKGTTRQERAACRGLLVGCAADWLRAGKEDAALSPEALLTALAVPEQVVDEEFPGYRHAGVLREMWLRYVHRTEDKEKETDNSTGNS